MQISNKRARTVHFGLRGVGSACAFCRVSIPSDKKALPLAVALQQSFAGGLVQVLADRQQHGIRGYTAKIGKV